MLVKCSKCPAINVVSPSALKRRGKKIDDYVCRDCYLKDKKNLSTKPDWNYYRAFKKLEGSNNGNRGNKKAD